MNLVLKRDPVWMQCLPTPEVSSTLLLIGGDCQKVAVPAHLLLAASPLVKSILTNQLPPAYSPCCISLPAATADVLQVFGDILTTGTAAGTHEEKMEELQQVFKMLGVEALIVRCHLASIKLGIVLDRNVKLESCDGVLDEENTCKFEVIVKQEGTNIVEEDNQVCPQNLTMKSSLNFNLEKRRMIRIPCDIRTQKFTQKSGLKVDIDSVYKKNESICKYCQKKFSSKNYLVQHIKSIHHKVLIRCNFCPQEFTFKPQLRRHIDSAHKKIEYPCEYCPKKYSRKESVKIHIQSVHTKVEFPCNHCSLKFNHKSNLRRHIDSVHKKIKYPCNHCIEKFTKKSSLKKHIETFHTEIEYA